MNATKLTQGILMGWPKTLKSVQNRKQNTVHITCARRGIGELSLSKIKAQKRDPLRVRVLEGLGQA